MSTATATYASILTAIQAAGLGAKLNIFNNGEAPLGTNGSDYATLIQKIATAGWDAVCGDSVAGDVVNTVRKSIQFVNHAGDIGGYQLSAYQDPWSHPVAGTYPHSDYVYTWAAPNALSESPYITKDSVVFSIHQAYAAAATSLGIVISDQAPGDIHTWIDVINSAQNSPVIDTIVLTTDVTSDIIASVTSGPLTNILQDLQAAYPPNTPIVTPIIGTTATTITAASSSYAVATGVSFTISGTLAAGGTGLASKTVTITRYDGTGNASTIGTPATNGSGVFAVTESESVAGNYTYNATFAGDTTYTSSSATTGTVVVGTGGGGGTDPVNPIAVGGHPCATTRGGGTIDVMCRGSNGELYGNYFNGSSWRGWANVGTNVLGSAPAVCCNNTNQLDLVAKGTDNAVYISNYNGSAWTSWVSLGGNSTYGPGICSAGGNIFDVFIVGTNYAMYWRWYSGGYSAWISIGGACYSDVSAICESSSALQAFVRGSNATLYEVYTNNGGTSWAWVALGGPAMLAGTGPGACTDGSTTHVFTNVGNQLYHILYAGSWSGWEKIGFPTGGAITSSPTAVVAGGVHVFVRGNDGACWTISGTGNPGEWGAWASIGGQM